MAQGGIDIWVRERIKYGFNNTPYDSPICVGSQYPEPVLIKDLVEDIWRDASREQLDILLFTLSGETRANATHALLASDTIHNVSALIRAVGLDIIAAIAAADPELAAEDERRRALYQTLIPPH
jgi:hypothetical protein